MTTSQEQPDKRSINDLLAYDRTVMANDRTLLAFVRTALTMVVTGLAFVKFLTVTWAMITGWALILLSPAFILLGVWRYEQMRRRQHQRLAKP